MKYGIPVKIFTLAAPIRDKEREGDRERI